MTKNDLMTKIENLTNALEASRETSDRLALQCREKDAELAAYKRTEEGAHHATEAALMRDIADRDAEISRLQAAITKGAQSAEWHHRRIADRDTLIADLRSDLEKAGAAHASDHIELVARREECAKLQGLLDQMTRWRDLASSDNDTLGRKLDNMTSNYAHQRDESARLAEELRLMTADRDGWKETGRTEQQNKIKARNQRDEETKARQRVQIQLDQATARIAQLEAAPCDRPVALFHAEQRLSEEIGKSRALGEELRKVRQALEAERGIVSRMGGELTEAKQALAPFLAAGGVVAVSVEVKACPCEPLQEHLANLHRTGAVILKQQQTLSGAMVAFIQAHTRAGDVLEGIENGESF